MGRSMSEVWAGDFGDAYTARNNPSGRRELWFDLLDKYPAERVLEVGCNIGANLRWIDGEVYGLDVNRSALKILKQMMPDVHTVLSPARHIPFRDGWFDLVFTAGVLIHIPRHSLKEVMAEIVRTSRKYVLCIEYFAPTEVEVPYRGLRGALFKRDYGRLYEEMGLTLVERGELHRPAWDEVTWWLLTK